ncbi:MAG: glutaredoxin family protein [Azoarcus sp.]|jgi:glutaredoxin|nr:glutaredoxin family protein [Azoarcus sp.]
MMNITINIPVAVLIVFASTAAMAEPSAIYRWKDNKGHIHYSDKPPPGDRAEPIEFASKTPASAPSYATRKAIQDFPVTLFTSVNCRQLCDDARDLLEKREVPFVEHQIGTEADLSAFYKRFGDAAEIPVLTVGTMPFMGFEPIGWHRQLDLAGYPKK